MERCCPLDMGFFRDVPKFCSLNCIKWGVFKSFQQLLSTSAASSHSPWRRQRVCLVLVCSSPGITPQSCTPAPGEAAFDNLIICSSSAFLYVVQVVCEAFQIELAFRFTNGVFQVFSNLIIPNGLGLSRA